MAGQKNILVRERVTSVGLESTYGSYTAGAFVAPSGAFPYCMVPDVFLYDDIGIDGLDEAREDVMTESTRRVDPKVPYHGLKIGTTLPGISKYCQATPGTAASPSAQMNSYWVRPTIAGGAGATAASILIGASLGGGTYFSDQGLSPKSFDQAGAVAVHSGSSPTTVMLASGSGSHFNAGTWIAVQTGTATTDGYDFTKVISVSSGPLADSLTVYPALSGTPVDGAIVKNLYNYFPAETHGTTPGGTANASVCVSRAFVGDSTAQVALQGVYGDVAFSFTQGDKAVQFKYGGKATDYVGPSALGLSTSAVTDTMGAVTRFAPQIYIQSSDSTGAGSTSFPNTITRGATLVCPKFTFEVKGNYEQVRDLNAPETVAGVLDSSGRPRFGACTFTVRFDQQAYVDFAKNPDVLYNIVVVQPIGSGVTQSFWLWEIPCSTLVKTPKATKVGEYMYVDLAFNPLPDGTQALRGSYSTVTMPIAAAIPTVGQLDAAKAAFRVAFG